MRSQLVVLGIVAALASCDVPLVTFSVGDTQPPPEDCDAVGDEDGNGLADCADPACIDTPACQAVCGNGVIDPGEVCDPPDMVKCSADCKSFISSLLCGNGIIDQSTGEECDPGIADSVNCNSNMANQIQPGLGCKLSKCGDGYTNIIAGEACDSGGDSAACNGNCLSPFCGDGYVNRFFTPPGSTSPEQCDTGGTDTATCNGKNVGSVSCHFAVCGDGYVNFASGEQCDNGGFDTATCNGNFAGSASCHFAVCGDGYVNTFAGEQCDLGGVPCSNPAKICNSACNCI